MVSDEVFDDPNLFCTALSSERSFFTSAGSGRAGAEHRRTFHGAFAYHRPTRNPRGGREPEALQRADARAFTK